MTPTTRALFWISTSALEVYFTYLWLFNGVYLAENLMKFWIIFNFITSLTCLAYPDVKEDIRKTGRSVPKQLEYIIYIVQIALFSSQGYFLFATLVTFSALFEIAIFDRND